MPREDFPAHVKQALQNRVASRCSSPQCRAATAGPQVDSSKALNVGVAAHITAASEGGPRYDPSLTSEQRSSAENGIWLCQNCAKLVDNDPSRYTVELLRSWKTVAEDLALDEIGKPAHAAPNMDTVRPIVVVEFECNFEENPEKPFTLRNPSPHPAFGVRISVIAYGDMSAEFELVPTLEGHSSREVMPDLPSQGLFFRNRLRPMLDKAWHETRWLPAQQLSKPEIEELFDQPVVFPFTVTYTSASRQEYVEHFELVYVYFAASAFVRFPRNGTAA
jgi:hypothetical protein